MRFRVRWPDGIVGRLVLLFVLAITVGSFCYWWLYGREHERESLERFATATATRMGSVVRLLKQVGAPEHEAVLNAARSHRFRVHIDHGGQPDTAHDDDWPFGERFRASLDTALADAGISPIELSILEFDRAGRSMGHLPRHWLRAVIPSNNDTKVVFHIGVDWRLLHKPTHRLFGLMMVACVIVGVMTWVAYRETKPLRRLAAAADRLGVDVNAPPLEATGSREVRAATEAFNRMQTRLQRFIADRTQMLAALSHDLRTPLTRLRLRAEFIADEEQQTKAVDDIEEMQNMISQALAFARDDAHAEKRERINLAAMLRQLAEARAADGLAVTYDGPASLMTHGQPLDLRRAFANIVDNAVRYGKRADIALTAEIDRALITIDDDGPGIPEDRCEDVFSPFYRLETSRNRETGGVGLGLNLARTTIRRHGGDVELSTPTKGTGLRVTLSLPSVQYRQI